MYIYMYYGGHRHFWRQVMSIYIYMYYKYMYIHIIYINTCIY